MTIAYRDTHEVDLDQLTVLFNAVGFARAISDGAFNADISTVAVLPDYQKRGIGRELVQCLMDGRDGIQLVLHANAGAYPFYLHLDLGFEPFEQVLMRPRRF